MDELSRLIESEESTATISGKNSFQLYKHNRIRSVCRLGALDCAARRRNIFLLRAAVPKNHSSLSKIGEKWDFQ